MNIKFTNGTNFEYLNALETEEYYNGASRRTLTFECEVGVIGVDKLNTLLSDEKNTKIIELSNGETTNVFDSYVIKLKCGIENKLVSAETPESLAVYEDKLVFKLGRRTFVEEYLHNQGF